LKRARFTKLARTEFLAQIAYYEADRPGRGSKFRIHVEDIAERAATYPKHGKLSAAETRRRLVDEFPYSIVYIETEYGILIHAVAADRLPPEYWLGRLTGAASLKKHNASLSD
jgi:plasmid stabilization system protein ParE